MGTGPAVPYLRIRTHISIVMIMKRLLALFAVVAFAAAPALSQNVGIGLRAGTTGAGIEIGYGFHPKLNIRGHFSTFSYNYTDTTTDEDPNLDLDADAGIGAFTSFVDFHPFSNSFRLTGGLGKNNFDVTATGVATENVCFGDEDGAGNCSGKEFTPDKLGSLGANISYKSSIHPYMGIGFGSLGNGESRVTFLFDLGVYYTGSPEIELENDGLFKPTVEAENVQVLNDGLESFKWYPVLSLGVGIRL